MLNLVVVPLIKQDWMVCLVYIHSALDSTHKDSFSVMGYRIWGLVLLGYTHAYVDAHVHVCTSGVSPKSGRAVFSCSTYRLGAESNGSMQCRNPRGLRLSVSQVKRRCY